MIKRRPPRGVAQRCKIGEASEILGESPRTIRNQATAGKIPGAARIFGTWTFDIAMLHAFVAQKERETSDGARRGASLRPLHRGAAPSPARTSDVAQTIQKLRLLAKQKRTSESD